MDRKWKSGALGTVPPTPNTSTGYPTEGNPGGAIPATKPGEWWYYMVTEELRNVLVAAGITPDVANLTQLAAAIAVIAAASSGGQVVQTTTLTGTQNNFAATAARRLVLRCNNATLLTLTGFAAGQSGDLIDVVSVGAGQVDLAHQAAGSSAANRLKHIVTSCVTSLAAGAGYARYIYDATATTWRLVNHEQGAWIASAINTTLGSFNASTVTTNRYWIRGNTLFWDLNLRMNPSAGNPTNADYNLPIAGATLLEKSSAAFTMLTGPALGITVRAFANAAGDAFLRIEFRKAQGVVENFAAGNNDIAGVYIGDLT
jgi:hypothetical protein